MARTALTGIAEETDAADFSSGWWFAPFGLDGDTVARTLLPEAVQYGKLVDGCALTRMNVPLVLPAGEPDGVLISWPGARCGLATLIVKRDGENLLTSAWPFTTDGVSHELAIDRVLMAPDRLQAMIEGTIDDTLPLTWLDPLFAADRAFYAEGSVHRVLLAGFAHHFAVGSYPPVRIGPDAPSYASLREHGIGNVDADGMITFRTEGLAAIMPADDSGPTVYAIQGPVKRIERYTGDLFGREVWDLRVTVARIGENHDRDVDLCVLLTDIVLAGRPLPRPGDDISATIRLQGRIWQANLQGTE